MNYKIREIRNHEYLLLSQFLYEAIFIPEGSTHHLKPLFPCQNCKYILKDFGKKHGDQGMVVEIDNKIVGAAWVRIMNDYGHIDNKTPSLAMSLYKEYRGYGIGTALLEGLLTKLKNSKYAKVSLSVQKANYAVKMYQKAGFKIVSENNEEYIMVADIS